MYILRMYSAVVVGGGGKRARIIVAQRITLRTQGSAENGKLQGVGCQVEETTGIKDDKTVDRAAKQIDKRREKYFEKVLS